MKTTRTALTVLATALAAAPAFAATPAGHTGILAWAFLGICGLIVVAQVVPAAVMLVEMIKGLVTKTEPETD